MTRRGVRMARASLNPGYLDGVNVDDLTTKGDA
jgi:hypothetical protein